MERQRRNFSPLPDMGPHVAAFDAAQAPHHGSTLTLLHRSPLTGHPTTAPACCSPSPFIGEGARG